MISGWKCTANGLITITFNGGPPVQAAYGTTRADTIPVCGDDGNNGFGLLWNWNILGAGTYTVQALDNGVEFASATATVTTLGQQFFTGLSGEFTLDSFPEVGQEVEVQWNEGLQNFIIAAATNRQPVDIIENSVANLTTVPSAFVVPDGKRLVITDVVISNPNASSATAQRILKNGVFVTSSITVAAGSAFSHTFATGLEFAAGDNVGVRNGDSVGPTHFYLRGFLVDA